MYRFLLKIHNFLVTPVKTLKTLQIAVLRLTFFNEILTVAK